MHPFDRYGAFTDLKGLLEFSGKSLRKSMRVNTLKCTAQEFLAWAKWKNWMVDPVPWCPEGFFVDRVDREEALGKDFLHLIGGVYMQEASSMLPVALLDPKPGERILDMSAAPGSKTTQIAARMGLPAIADGPGGTNGMAHLRQGYGGRPSATAGILVANDVQEKRIWSLITNLQRCGVTNAIVTRKVGQWFAGNMTEVFDRVLCDAPCTAQGTVRKDDTALNYCSDDNIGKMARLQRELLESAVHACKVGGRIVYSTCTLTPEENEAVVLSVLSKYPDQLTAILPSDRMENGQWKMDNAIDDSLRVQHWLKKNCQLSIVNCPFLRVWPQTFDTEGFFCAVLEKRAPTRDRGKKDLEPHRFDLVPKSRTKAITDRLEDWYGAPFLRANEVLIEYKEQLSVMPEDFLRFFLPVKPYMSGLPFGKSTSHGLTRLSHEMATLRGREALKQVLAMSEEELKASLRGVNVKSAPVGFDDGDILLSIDAPALGRPLVFGRGMLKEGTILNRLPRDLVRMFT